MSLGLILEICFRLVLTAGCNRARVDKPEHQCRASSKKNMEELSAEGYP